MITKLHGYYSLIDTLLPDPDVPIIILKFTEEDIRANGENTSHTFDYLPVENPEYYTKIKISNLFSSWTGSIIKADAFLKGIVHYTKPNLTTIKTAYIRNTNAKPSDKGFVVENVIEIDSSSVDIMDTLYWVKTVNGSIILWNDTLDSGFLYSSVEERTCTSISAINAKSFKFGFKADNKDDQVFVINITKDGGALKISSDNPTFPVLYRPLTNVYINEMFSEYPSLDIGKDRHVSNLIRIAPDYTFFLLDDGNLVLKNNDHMIMTS